MTDLTLASDPSGSSRSEWPRDVYLVRRFGARHALAAGWVLDDQGQLLCRWRSPLPTFPDHGGLKRDAHSPDEKQS